jgi:O-antigen/teichoic acid export membrane protein
VAEDPDELSTVNPDELPEAPVAEESLATSGVNQRGAITLVGTLVGAALMFGNEILAARFLGLTLYGCYALAVVIARIGEEVSMFGFGISVLHFVPVYLRNGDRPRLFGAILLGMAFPLVIGIALIGVMWFAAPAIADYVLHEPRGVPYLRLFAVAIPLIGVSEILGRITRGFGHAIYHVAIREVVPRVVYFALLLGLVLSDSYRVWIGLAFIASYFCACIVGILSTVKLTGRELWTTKPVIPFREMYAYSIWSYATVLLALVMGATDYVMIGVLGTSDEAGLYRGSLQYANTLILIIHAFAAGTIHLYPVLIKEKRQKELEQVYATASTSINYLAAFLFVMIVLNRTDLLLLLGDQFAVAAPALFVLLVANLVRSCTGLAPYVLLVTGHQRLEMLNAAVGIASTILLNLWLIPLYGIMGAAVTTLVTNIILAVLRTIQLKSYFQLNTLNWRWLAPILIACGLGAAIVVLTHMLGIADGSGMMAFAIRIPLSVVMLAAGLIAAAKLLEKSPNPQLGSEG